MVRVRKLIAVTLSIVVVLGLGGFELAGPANAATVPNTLYEGHSLEAGTAHDRLDSANGAFSLMVWPGVLDLRQTVPFGPGKAAMYSDFWQRTNMTGPRVRLSDHSILRLQTNGNLVLKTHSGHALWSTGTAGKHNRLVLLSNGDLILYNSSNHLLWSSATRSVAIGSGHRLASGAELVQRPPQGEKQPVVDKITMRTDGDLVYTCNSHIAWRSHTKVHGSYLSLQLNGDLVIRTPAGKAVWTSRTTGAGPDTFFDFIGVNRIYGSLAWLIPFSRGVPPCD